MVYFSYNELIAVLGFCHGRRFTGVLVITVFT